MNKFLRLLLLIPTIACFVFAGIPVVLYQIFNTGVVALLVLGVLFFAEFRLLKRNHRDPWEVFCNRGRGVVAARRLLTLVLTLFVVAELAMSAIMLTPSLAGGKPAPQGTTAVVLGGGISEDKPKLMLQRRLEQVLLYLEANPDTKVIVTGGQDNKYPYTEAYVQHKWLTERGIATERIIIEDKSHDTYQNLQNAVTLLGSSGLPSDMMIFTDTFHQLRGQLYARLAVARQTGQPEQFFAVAVGGIGSNTPWGLLPCYWLREQAGLLEAFFLTDLHTMYF